MLSAIWGSSFIFIKLSVITIDPQLLTFYRLVVASIALAVFFKNNNLKNCFIKNKVEIFIIAFIGNVIPFNLISYSEIFVDSIIASTLIGTMPMFTFLISFLIFKKERFKMINFLSLALGFLGMTIFINPENFFMNLSSYKFYALILFSSICYAFSANIVKKVKGSTPSDIAITSTILAAVMCFPILLANLYFFEQQLIDIFLKVSFKSFISATVLGLVCTAFAIFIFFSLIKSKSAVFASQSNYLIPFFGSIWGVIFLNESISLNMFLGLILIVLSGWLINRNLN